MRPILVRYYWGHQEPLLLLDVLPDGRAVIVEDGGRLGLVPVEDLQVEKLNPDFPMGYNFSRSEAEAVEK